MNDFGELSDFGVRVEHFHSSEITEPRNTFVFLHGIEGSNQDTWRAPNGYSLLHFVRQEFAASTILSIGYPTSFTANDHFDEELYIVAEAVRARILGILPKGKPIHFICHSQGGLLCQLIISQAEHEADQNASYSSLLERVASITFLDTPHSGSRIASVINSTLRLVGLQGLASKQLQRLERNDTSLAGLNARFLTHLTNRGTRVLNVVSKKKIVGLSVAESELQHPNVATVRVGVGHSKICKPESEEDEICVLMEPHLAVSANHHQNQFASTRTCIIHFLDHHFLTMKSIPHGLQEIQRDTHNELVRTFRLALMAFDKVIIPMSSIAESEIAIQVFRDHQSDLLNVYSSERHTSIQDYIDDSTKRAGSAYVLAPNEFERFGLSGPISVLARSRSATPDILEGIQAVDVDRLLFSLRNLADASTLEAVRNNWFNFPESDAANFVVPPSFHDFVLEGRRNGAFFRAVSQIINELYFNSFLTDFNAWIANPSNVARHDFTYLDERRVLDVRSIAMETSWRSKIPVMVDWDLAAVEKAYYSSSRLEFQNEFWARTQEMLLQ